MSGSSGTKASRDKSDGQVKQSAQEQVHQPALSEPQADVLALQRTAGNRAVSKSLQSLPVRPRGDLGSVPPIVRDVLRSRGQPLDPTTRASMESSFGHDLGQVRVHTDAQAAESARELSARAYTVGQNVVFGEGRYTPSSSEGKQLLAHELAHVVQQNQPGGVRVSTGSAEQEAALASSRASGGQAAAVQASVGTGIQRSPGPLKPRVQVIPDPGKGVMRAFLVDEKGKRTPLAEIVPAQGAELDPGLVETGIDQQDGKVNRVTIGVKTGWHVLPGRPDLVQVYHKARRRPITPDEQAFMSTIPWPQHTMKRAQLVKVYTQYQQTVLRTDIEARVREYEREIAEADRAVGEVQARDAMQRLGIRVPDQIKLSSAVLDEGMRMAVDTLLHTLLPQISLVEAVGGISLDPWTWGEELSDFDRGVEGAMFALDVALMCLPLLKAGVRGGVRVSSQTTSSLARQLGRSPREISAVFKMAREVARNEEAIRLAIKQWRSTGQLTSASHRTLAAMRPAGKVGSRPLRMTAAHPAPKHPMPKKPTAPAKTPSVKQAPPERAGISGPLKGKDGRQPVAVQREHWRSAPERTGTRSPLKGKEGERSVTSLQEYKQKVDKGRPPPDTEPQQMSMASGGEPFTGPGRDAEVIPLFPSKGETSQFAGGAMPTMASAGSPPGGGRGTPKRAARGGRTPSRSAGQGPGTPAGGRGGPSRQIKPPPEGSVAAQGGFARPPGPGLAKARPGRKVTPRRIPEGVSGNKTRTRIEPSEITARPKTWLPSTERNAIALADKGMRVTQAYKTFNEQHHLLVQKHRRWFEAKGIDIDRYSVTLTWGEHSATHSKGWVPEWDRWIASHQNASKRQIRSQMNRMRRKYKLEREPITTYKK